MLDDLNHLVARVELEPGYTVSFYEPEPGIIGVSETTPIDGERILRSEDVRDRSMVQLYEKLSGGKAPTALVEAQKRATEARQHATECQAESVLAKDVSSAPEIKASPLDDGIASTSRSLTSSDGPWWAVNVCYGTGDFRGCFPNWGGGGFAQASAKTSFFQIAPFSGNSLSVRFQYEGVTKFTDAVFPGQWAGWWWHSDAFWDCWCSPICACGTQDYNLRLHRWDILNATGDGFHWTHAFKSTCGDTLSCDATP